MQVIRGQEGWGRGVLVVEGSGRELGWHLGVCLPVTGAGVMGPLCDGKTQEYEWG